MMKHIAAVGGSRSVAAGIAALGIASE